MNRWLHVWDCLLQSLFSFSSVVVLDSCYAQRLLQLLQIGHSDKKAEQHAMQSAKSCCRSFPTQVQQGLIWVWADDSPQAHIESAMHPPTVCPEYGRFENEGILVFEELLVCSCQQCSSLCQGVLIPKLCTMMTQVEGKCSVCCLQLSANKIACSCLFSVASAL